MDSYKLFSNILHLETEDDVVELLKKEGIWTNKEFWKPYGDMENNIGTIANQQTNPFAAFAEKVVNSIDAIFMRECKRENIDPESASAPSSMKEAKERYKDNITKDDIQIYATGNDKSSMNVIIADYGEGQSPNSFEKTLLSLNKSNKLKIPFVQGKFNMGSTGVIPFCGKYNIQLIVSKKDPKIKVDDELSNYWTFTITRKNSFDKTRKSSLIECLQINGKMPVIEKETLNILPDKNKAGATYTQAMNWGTYIKLYNYKSKHTSVIKARFMYKLSQILPGMPIDAFVSDRRDLFETPSNKLTTTLKGNLSRIMADNRLEEGFPLKSMLSIHNEKIKVEMFLIKNLKSNNDYSAFKDDEGIAYIVNGQVHGYTNQRIFKRKGIDLDYIYRNLLVYVDITDIDTALREELVMSNRESLRDSTFKHELEDLVIEEIKNCKQLYIENERVRREKLKNRTNDDSHIVNSLKKVLKSNPSIASLFDIGLKLPNINDVEKSEEEKVDFVGMDEPSFFDITKDFTFISPKEVPINKKFRIQFKTDVKNDFFDRDFNAGTFDLINDEGKEFNYSVSLHNGKCTLTGTLPDTVKLNELLSFTSIVKGVNNEFINQFYVKVIDKENKEANPSKKAKKDNTKLNLPHMEEVFKNDWQDWEFDETSVLKINGNDYIINMDNVYLKKNIQKNSERKDQYNEEYKTMYLMYGIALQHKNSIIENEEEKIDIERATSALAPVLFETTYIIDELRRK